MTAARQIQLLFQLIRVRRIEEAIAVRYSEKKMRCPVHLSIGQEAVAVGVCQALAKEDRVFSNHRCHAHYLAKGGDLSKMIAELYGKQTGCAKGKGGSMHLVDPAVGMMGASALVGGTIPLAVGSALGLQQRDLDVISVAFFGDGATEEGIFFESLNFAALKKLPVLFVCENNLYATYSPIAQRQANPNISEKVAPFGLKTYTIDGNDAEAVYECATEARSRALERKGPAFIECLTYRWKDHVGPAEDHEIGYRTHQEIESWKATCPIDRLLEKLLRARHLSSRSLEEYEAKVEKQIADAFAFAEESPFPAIEELGSDIYA